MSDESPAKATRVKRAPREPLPPAPNWLELFLDFISNLTIDSKELEGPAVLELYGSQKRFLAEIIDGLERGIHDFFCLKARQLGISSIALAIDLFWLVVHPGLQGALVCDEEGNRDKFRILISRYIASLPKKYQIKVKLHNRANLVLENGSVLDYLVAGRRRSASSADLGRSRAYNFLHCTEVSAFGNFEGVVSLIATLAEKHPNRLFIYESTAKSYNLWWTMWNQAIGDPITKKAFFIGWWSKESYSLEEGTALFKRYWDGMVTVEEQEAVNKVYEKYGVRITPGQIAWYRWKTETTGSGTLMSQNYPWDEDEAFISTGQAYFPARKVAALIRELSANPPPFKGYAYEFGEKFMETKLVPVSTVEESELKVYEEPNAIGEYVIGVDTAFGRSETQDRSVIQIARCYSDRLVQVAEFCSASPQNYQVAWALAHLIGVYQNVMTIIEITGPGDATVLELKHLREMFDAGAFPQPGDGSITDVFGNARFYMYHRQDSPGAGFCYNWKSSMENKQAIMGQLRDSQSLDMLEVRSIQCLLEMQGIVQNGFAIEPAVTSGDDDRVMALAFAHRAWTDWVRPPMISHNRTLEREQAREEAEEHGGATSLVSHIVSEFFAGKDQDRENEEIDRMWE